MNIEVNKGMSKESNKGMPKEANKGMPKEANKDTLKEANKGILNEANKGILNEANKGILNEANKGILKETNKDIPNEANKGIPNEGSSEQFFQLNTNISKFIFILLILIIFVMLFNMGLFIIEYLYSTNRSPYLINGMMQSNTLKIISSNPNVSNSVPIMRSVNEITGIEYSWGVWVYIEDPYFNKGNKYKRIFSKGTHTMIEELNETYNISFLNNSPGLYYNEDENKLICVFNTFSSDSNIYETIDISSTPIEKWIYIVITVKHKTVNIYVNSILSRSYTLTNVPKQNYYDTTVGDKKGFSGYISNLRYYDYALSDESIQNNMAAGPNKTITTTDKINDAPPWLSMNWYYNS